MLLLLLSTAVFLISWGLVGGIGRLAFRRGLLDVPNQRSSHEHPTPRLGGLGILGAMLVAASVARWGLGGEITAIPTPFVALATGIGLVSLLDDLHGIPALLRLAAHAAAGGLAIVWLGTVETVGLTASTTVSLGPLGWLLTAIWIVGFINAFNFMDGIDGIAGLQASIAATGWALAGVVTGQPVLVVTGAAIAAATGGFLVHNWPRAHIFMGDVGSASLGFMLAALPLLGVPASALFVPAILMVWPFVFDTAFTLARRARRGENVLSAHRSHLYQRLTQAGWAHVRVAQLFAALAVSGAMLALAVVGRAVAPWFAVVVSACAGLLLWTLVVLAERRRTAPAMMGPTGGIDHA